MTRCAVQIGVCPTQREAGDFQVIELRAAPSVERVAGGAVGGEIQREVVRALRSPVLLHVATGALGGESLVLSRRGAFVARGTICDGVSSKQWKSVLVLADALHRHLPTLYRVAALAFGPELALVNVGVTIGAFLSNIREHELAVALRARDARVHPSQRIPRLVMIEFGNLPNRLP